MRWGTTGPALMLLALVVSGCNDSDPLTPPEIDPVGEYTVTTTIVSNTCVESNPCEPLCRLTWFAIDEEQQPLYIGRYGSDLVVCPLGPLDSSLIVGGNYADGTFTYDISSGIIVSSPGAGLPDGAELVL